MAKKSSVMDEEEQAPPVKQHHHEPPQTQQADPVKRETQPSPEGDASVNPLAAPTGPAVPTAITGTHFRGPVVVGPIAAPNSGPTVAADQSGEAVLAKRFDLTASDFTGYLITFPVGSVLMSTTIATYTAFNGTTPTLKIGITSGGSEIAAITPLPAAGSVLVTPNTKTLPANAAGQVGNGPVYLSLSGASTTGAGHVIFQFCGRPAKKWN